MAQGWPPAPVVYLAIMSVVMVHISKLVAWYRYGYNVAGISFADDTPLACSSLEQAGYCQSTMMAHTPIVNQLINPIKCKLSVKTKNPQDRYMIGETRLVHDDSMTIHGVPIGKQ
jgi:hypothetical protein